MRSSTASTSRIPRGILAVLVGAALGACASPGGDTTIDITHDACAPLAVVAPGASAAQAAGIEAALALWRAHGAAAITRVEAPTADALAIHFEDAAPAFHGLYDDEAGVIYVNTDVTDPAALAIVIAHELGHALGLPHVTDRASLMNPGNLALPPTAEDEAALRALWGACAAPGAPASPVLAAPLVGAPRAR